MIKLFYKFLTLFTRIFGTWFFKVFSRFVSAGYFLLFPSRVAIGVRFYRALFPERGRAYCLWLTWRQFHGFTDVFLDRFLLQTSGDISYTSEGWDILQKAADEKTGGVIVMSHMGNWDVAAHLLRKRGLRLLLFMGMREKEQLEKMQKESLAESGMTVIAVNWERARPSTSRPALYQGRRPHLPDRRPALTGPARGAHTIRARVLLQVSHRIAPYPSAALRILCVPQAINILLHIRTHPGFGLTRAGRTAPCRNPPSNTLTFSLKRRGSTVQWYHFENLSANSNAMPGRGPTKS